VFSKQHRAGCTSKLHPSYCHRRISGSESRYPSKVRAIRFKKEPLGVLCLEMTPLEDSEGEFTFKRGFLLSRAELRNDAFLARFR